MTTTLTPRISGTPTGTSARRVATATAGAMDPWGGTWGFLGGNTWGRTWHTATAAVPPTPRVSGAAEVNATKRVIL